jgi:plastocyanin domain-containing protein
MSKTTISFSRTSLNKTIIISVGILLVVGFIWFFATSSSQTTAATGDAVTMVNGIQIIQITARGGYKPNNINAKSNVPTSLWIQTTNTFDCSASVTIPKLNVRENLPNTGNTEIKIPEQASGTTLTGVCSMGMYSFKINFN